MCKCIIAILLADLVTLSLLYTSFIELNNSNEHYNIHKLLQDDYTFDGKEEATVIMFSYLTALVVHTLAIIIKYIYHIICCCDFCCCSCGNRYEDVVYA